MNLNTLLYLLICNSSFFKAFWWWFSEDNGNTMENKQGSSESFVQTKEIQAMFAPFEISLREEKFLLEAQTYLQNLPMLDQCNLLIINRLKSSCKELSDEELSKLSVNLLNCQSAVEGRPIFQCTDNMKLSECTKDMDSDIWNAYHIISNRARSICYNMRQTEFHMRTEQTVNNLASAALQNINMLNSLSSGQKQLQEETNTAFGKIANQHEEMITQQKDLRDQQSRLGSAVNHNMQQIMAEKRLIASRSKQVEEYTQMINEQLASLINEIKSQDEAKKQGEKEILKDLDTVKLKANEVLKKLENAFVDLDSYHDNIESKQNKTLENLEEIQKTIVFMNEVLGKLYSSFHEQLPWIHDMFGGTVDKLTLINVILGHLLFFILTFFIIIFVSAPFVTRVILLVITTINFMASMQGLHHLSYNHMSWFVAFTVPFHYIFAYFNCLWRRYKSNCHNKDNTSPVYCCNISPLKVEAAVRDLNETFNSICSPIRMHSFSSTPSKEFENSFIVSDKKQERFAKLIGSGSPHSSTLSEKLNHSTNLETTIGGSLKCTAKNKSGRRCKNSSLANHSTCHVHTPLK